ncbi:hypothetical protein M6B38_205135 [Iris pallida]|uniref:Uncharacterized protein n=1 Tax=Iris pallida TaxID=29817 RepID=A0AAX6E863_IRIPA|nr:hypothetical protein M6B38_205135 [Iris pallida]
MKGGGRAGSSFQGMDGRRLYSERRPPD